MDNQLFATKKVGFIAMLKQHNIKEMIRLFVIVLICTLYSQSARGLDATVKNLSANHALPEFHAIYAIQYFGVKAAEAHYDLSYTDTGYKFTQKTKLSGLASIFADDTVSVISLVDEKNAQLLLTKHIYIQTGKEKNRNEDIDIKWDTKETPPKAKITGTVRGKKINIESDTPVWEVLSFQLPLMLEAKTDIKNYSYKAILKGAIDTYDFVLKSSKKISFADKEYTALQMVRTDPRKNRQLHIWLIPELNNIPVIIENYRKGKIHSNLALESVKFNNETTYSNMTEDDDDL